MCYCANSHAFGMYRVDPALILIRKIAICGIQTVTTHITCRVIVQIYNASIPKLQFWYGKVGWQ